MITRSSCLLLVFPKCTQTSTRSVFVPWCCCVHGTSLWTSTKKDELGTGPGNRQRSRCVGHCCREQRIGHDARAHGADGMESWLRGKDRVVAASVFLAALAPAGAESLLVHVFPHCSPSLLLNPSLFLDQALFMLLNCLELNLPGLLIERDLKIFCKPETLLLRCCIICFEYKSGLPPNR